MNLVEQAILQGELCHIRINDGQIITDVRYTGDVDNAGKKYQKFVNGTQTHVVNPSYVAQIIRPKRTEEATNEEMLDIEQAMDEYRGHGVQ